MLHCLDDEKGECQNNMQNMAHHLLELNNQQEDAPEENQAPEITLANMSESQEKQKPNTEGDEEDEIDKTFHAAGAQFEQDDPSDEIDKQ